MKKLNKREQLANEIFRQVTTGYIYDLEDSDNELLENHEKLVNKIYDLVIGDEWCGWFDFCQDTCSIREMAGNGYLLRRVNDSLRFCGKDFLMECIEKHVAKNGY